MALSRILGLLILALCAVVIVPSFAQDKKDEQKEAKKDAAKKDEPKADDKKDAKKEDAKDEKSAKKKSAKDDGKPAEEKVEYGQVLTAKIKQMDSESPKDIVLEVQIPDPVKILQFSQWKQQQAVSIGQQQNPLQRAQQLRTYQLELIKRQNDLTKGQDLPVRAGDAMKVRVAYPPIEYDDKGNPKRWTQKELAALKGNSKLPGYPAEFDSLRPGQIVRAYFSKQSSPTGAAKGKLKKKDDDDDLGMAKPEMVMIEVVIEAPPK